MSYAIFQRIRVLQAESRREASSFFYQRLSDATAQLSVGSGTTSTLNHNSRGSISVHVHSVHSTR
jgi:hypothetical protein